MRLERSHEYEARVRAVRKRLALDFRPLKDTLAKGLDVLIDPEAAVYCTATVEAFCDALFSAIIKSLQDDAATSVAPLDTKVTVYHIQVALRSHSDLAQVLARVRDAALVLEFFLDDATSRALYDRQLLATPEAKHLRASASGDGNDDALIVQHARTRAEWQKRADDPFSDVDFATVLKCAHPAFTLSYNATALLSALVRELLNAVCDLADVETAQRRVPPELYLADLDAPLTQIFHVGDAGEQIARTARDVLERFRLQSRKGATLTLRFRLYAVGAGSSSAPLALANVPRDTPFAQLLAQMSRKCRTDAAATAVVYRGHQVELAATPAILAMPTGAVVYLVAKKWWDYTRRNEARRGLLSSLRPQDAQLKSLVASTASRVKTECQALRRDDSSELKRVAPQSLRRSNNALGSAASLHGSAASPTLRSTANGDGDDGDSLTQLLKQRPTPSKAVLSSPSPFPSRSLRQSRDNNNSRSSASLEALPHGATTRSLAARNAQLMATLDAAWLGFAAVSSGARSMSERMSKWRDEAEQSEQQQQQPPLGAGRDSSVSDAVPSQADLAELERELLAQLDKTEELVAKTVAAKQMVAQLVEHVQSTQQQQQQQQQQQRRRPC